MEQPVVDRLFASAANAHLGIVRADVWPAAIFARSEQEPSWESLDVVRRSARTHRLDVLGLLDGTLRTGSRHARSRARAPFNARPRIWPRGSE